MSVYARAIRIASNVLQDIVLTRLCVKDHGTIETTTRTSRRIVIRSVLIWAAQAEAISQAGDARLSDETASASCSGIAYSTGQKVEGSDHSVDMNISRVEINELTVASEAPHVLVIPWPGLLCLGQWDRRCCSCKQTPDQSRHIDSLWVGLHKRPGVSRVLGDD